MQFQIVSIADNFAPFMNEDGTVAIFNDGKSAADVAIQLTTKHGKKFQPRPIKGEGDEWKERERARFASGSYRAPLFVERDWFKANTEIADHFVHVSTEKPSMLAFTETAEQGRADRQTRLRVGRYLQRFFPQIDPDTLRRECEMHAGAFELDAVQFATTADEIEEVYTNGPHSCMAQDASEYSSSPHHPSAVYAGPDLAVAYMRVGDARVSARCVVWPDRKIFSRVYGSSALANKLTAMGYSDCDNLSGARVRKIQKENHYVMPYVDGISMCHVEGDYIVLGRGSRSAVNIDCQNTHGLSGAVSVCDCCDEAMNADSGTVVRVARHDTEHWCDSCAEEAIYMDRYHEYAIEEIVVEVANGMQVYQWVRDAEYFQSDYGREWHHNDDAITVFVQHCGELCEETWSSSEAYENATSSDYSGDFYHNDATVRLANGEYWGIDEFNADGFECEACGTNHQKCDAHEHNGKTICDHCIAEVEAEKQRTEEAINALRHPMLAAALYANLCLPLYKSNS